MTVELIISCCNTHQLLDIMKRNRLCDATVDFRWLARGTERQGYREGREGKAKGEEGVAEGGEAQQLNFA